MLGLVNDTPEGIHRDFVTKVIRSQLNRILTINHVRAIVTFSIPGDFFFWFGTRS